MVVDMANRHKVGDARSQCGPEHYYYFKEQGKCNGNKEMYRKIEISRFSVFFRFVDFSRFCRLCFLYIPGIMERKLS